MSPLDWLENRIRPIAIPYLTQFIIAGQTACFVGAWANPQMPARTILKPQLVLDGEYWRLFSFPFHAFAENPFWFLLGMWAFHFMGTTLEKLWGTARYNIYLFSGYFITGTCGFIYPNQPVSNFFIVTSVFLAFATYFPDLSFRIFLIVPVKAKWLAGLMLGFHTFCFITGEAQTRVSIAASLSNFLLFFGPTIVQRLKKAQRTAHEKADQRRRQNQAFHECRQCGRTDKTNPDLEFRYCSKCTDNPCYCEDHIGEHEHVVTETPETT